VNLAHLVKSSVALPLRAVDTGVRAAQLGVATATVLTAAGVTLVDAPLRAAARLPGVLSGQPARRRWTRDDRCWIEVRGLADDEDGVIGATVLEKLRAEPGVREASLNRPLARVMVRFAPSTDIEELCDVVADAEAAALGGPAESPGTELPWDGPVLIANAAAAAVNIAGLATALAGRVMPWPAMPSGVAAAAILVDYQPRLRAALEQRLGATAADTAITLTTAAAYTLTQAPWSLAIDATKHLARAAETQSAARAWRIREPDLAEHADCDDAVLSAPRPRPLPAGPIERHGDRSSVVQMLTAAGLAVSTARLDAAATAILVAAPKAARNSREAFASTLSRGLADRHGVLPVRPAALRRFDRVDAVVVDPRVLGTDELRVGRMRNVDDRDLVTVWQWAQRELDRGNLRVGWQPAQSRSNGSSGGEILVRHARHPLAAGLLGELRRGPAESISLDVDYLDDLRAAFDDLSPCEADSVDDALADLVRRLQSEGRTVAVVSTDAAQAMCDADVAIGVRREDTLPWRADLITDDLAGAWRIVHALGAGRRASERGVQLATGASLLGALLMIPGVRGRGPTPVTAGAAAGAWTGFSLARGVLTADAPQPVIERDWHAMTVDEVRRELPPPQPAEPPRSRSRLTSTATTASGAVWSVVDPARRAVWQFAGAMRSELSDPLTPVLAIGSAASAVLGSPVDAVLVGSVLTGNAALAATQRLRAERLLQRMLTVQDPPARRRTRDNGYETVQANALRPGDVIEVRPGEVVPADARIVNAADVEVDESALTGESLPVPKHVEPTPAAPVAERACMLHATTTVVAGTAVAVVTTVGSQTQARRAAHSPHSEGSTVGLQAQLRELTDKAWPFSLAGGAAVTGLGLLRRAGLRQAVSSGVAVSVAAVPEGLPLVATLAQQASARRLTRVGALVRTPRSVEALGRVDVVCFDKTGTLSENRLRVNRVEAGRGSSDERVLDHAARATPPPNGDGHEHATDAAVAEAAANGDVGECEPARARLPFRSGRPFSASICGDVLSVKGSPEAILAACGHVDDAVARTVQEMATDGLRVIAVARRELTQAQIEDVGDDADALIELCSALLSFEGLLGLSDTPRPDAAAVLAGLADSGIGVRLITGDHPVTAVAIAAELGLDASMDQVISGADWEGLSRRGQEEAVEDRVVFARMSPEHKVQIVQTLERLGQVCAMVGDGANDAAAIRAATVGIGVASRGSDPARTAADVMLLDGRIGSLLDALDEGRQLWRRVQSAVAVLLGGNAGEVAFAIIGTALSGRAPLNARQLLLVNMLTDALPAAALAVSPPSAGQRTAGRGPDQAALGRTVAVRGAATAAAATAAWGLARVTGREARASTIGLVTLVSTQLGQTLIDSHSPLVVSTAAGSLVVLGALISTPGVSQLLGCTPLGPLAWGQALTTATVATGVAALAPRLFAPDARDPEDQSTISTMPSATSTAYTSRTGTASTRATASVNGSEPSGEAMTTTVRTSGDETSNTP
jgi:H+-transporting ATPase